MFRRRTDQVYATLQQVQRRITEQAGGQQPAEIGEPAPAAQTLSPLHETLGRQAKPALVAMQPEIPPPPMSLPQMPQLPRPDAFLTVSKQMALTLVVLWIVCCYLFFVLGSHSGDHHDGATAGYAAGEPGNREGAAPSDAAAARPLGDYLLVLESVPTWSPEVEKRYLHDAAELNAVMVKHTGDGWKPWFGIRKPDNGSLEFVFGEVADHVYGINKDDFNDFALELKKYRGFNYFWVQLK